MLEKIGLKIAIGSVTALTVAFSGFMIWLMADTIRTTKKDEKLFDEAMKRHRQKYDELERRLREQIDKGVV